MNLIVMDILIQLMISFLSVCDADESGFVKFIDSEVEISRQSNLATITLPFSVLEGYVIQSDLNSRDELRATKMVFLPDNEIEVLDHSFTVQDYDLMKLIKEKIMVIRDDFRVNVEVRLPVNHQGKLKGVLYYQAWSNNECYFPRALEFEIEIQSLLLDADNAI